MIVNLDTNLAGIGSKNDVVEVEDLYGQGLVAAGFATEVVDAEQAADAVPVIPAPGLADTPPTDAEQAAPVTAADAERASDDTPDEKPDEAEDDAAAKAKADRDAAEADAQAKPATKSGASSK